MPTREPADWLLRRLIDRLSALPAAPRYLVGLSGGRDSMVLLHSLCAIADTLPGTIEAVHINHGLQAGANEWGGILPANLRSLARSPHPDPDRCRNSRQCEFGSMGTGAAL